MSKIVMELLSKKFGLNLWIVKSWFLHGAFYDIKSGTKFFEDNIEIIKATPFVKWVGGKRQLISQLEKLLPKEINNYFEPFVGGGALFFNLQKEKSFLSDINKELINTYQVIKDNPTNLLQFLETCKYNKEFYQKIRAWDRQENWQDKYTKIQRAGRFIYLNRTCFNGLYRVNSKGEFNVPMGSYKNPDFIQKDNIINTSKLLNKVKAEIKVQSFEKILDNASIGDFIYFDPPYDTLTETANFTSYNEGGFGREMQLKLRNVFVKLDEMGCKVMLSNHNTDFIREIYAGFRFEIVKARRNVNSKGSGRGIVEEIVVMNY